MWNPKANSIFLQAVELDSPEQRRAYLDQACDGDAALRERVESLLAASDPENDFLESPAVAVDATLQSSAVELIGTQIGPYKLVEQIGEGGMGVVYMAEQTEPIRRKVALKIIKAGMDTKQVVARFEAERQALALMDHPNIAKVLDAGVTESQRPYFVMELVKGPPITEFCDRHELGMPERLRLFALVCQAIQHAHQKGVIHRDLKPTNILVEMYNVSSVPKVIDFGVAKATGQQLTERTLVTGFDQMIGTPLYMSPEQASQNAMDVDTRSDVYSLGVLLYELLTGTTPFYRETLFQAGVDGMRRIIREQDPPLPSKRLSTLHAANDSTIKGKLHGEARQLQRHVAGELDWIVMRALEKDRSRRYQSAGDMAADVQRYLDGDAVQACPPSKIYSLRKFARRNKTVLLAVSLVIVSLVVGIGVSFQQMIIADGQRREAEKSGQEAIEQRNFATEQQKLALQNQYNAEIVSGQADLERGNIGNLHRKLISHLPVKGEKDRRGWEWYYLLSMCHPEERTMFHRGSYPFASWSPDGKYIATAGSIWDAASGECFRYFSSSSILRYRTAWSPDGQKFAWGMAADDNTIYIWDRAADTISTLRGHKSSVWCVAWSPDGIQLASGSHDQTVRIWDVARGTTVRTIPAEENVSDVAWSPDGELLVVGVKNATLKVWKPATGELVFEKEGPQYVYPFVSWHPDGEQLAVCAGKRWYLLNRADWTVVHEQSLTTGICQDIAWHPTGAPLAVAHGEVVTIWRPNSEQPSYTIRGNLRPIKSLAWSPDGEHLVTSDDAEEIKIWDWDRPAESHGEPIESLAWLTDGTTLVTDVASETLGSTDLRSTFWDSFNQQSHSEGVSRGISSEITKGSVQRSPNRQLLAVDDDTAEEPMLRILDANSRAIRAIWQGRAQHRLYKFIWSPDSMKIAIETTFEGHGFVEFWDVDQKQTISRWKIALTGRRKTPSQEKTDHPSKKDRLSGYVYFVGQNGFLRFLQWSNDSSRLAVATQGDVGDNGSVLWMIHAHVVDVATGSRILKHKLGGGSHSGQVTAFAWSPDGHSLACGGSQGLIEVIDSELGHLHASSKPHNGQIDSLAWSPDGQRLASGAQDGHVKVLSVTGIEELLTLPFAEDVPTHVTWSPDGQRLSVASRDGKLYGWDASRGYEFSEKGARRDELARFYYRRASRRGDNGGVNQLALREFLRLSPDKLGFWQLRGNARAMLGDFKGAAQEFAKGIGSGWEFSYGPAFYQTFALLGAGDLDAYHNACISFVNEFSDSDIPSNRQYAAWFCALSPNPLVDSKAVLQLAQSRHDHDHLAGDSDLLRIGACLVRDAQYDEAVRTLSTLADRLKSGNSIDKYQLACSQYFVALARHGQGNDTLARQRLADATRNTNEYRQLGGWWRYLAVLKALQREAESALSTAID